MPSETAVRAAKFAAVTRDLNATLDRLFASAAEMREILVRVSDEKKVADDD